MVFCVIFWLVFLRCIISYRRQWSGPIHMMQYKGDKKQYDQQYLWFMILFKKKVEQHV